MPFVSRFSGHGRLPGIHKPAAPPVPTVTNTATTFDTLTFTIGNYNAAWTYTGSISPSAGTITFSGATVTITGLTGSTAYTLTVTAIGSGGRNSGTGSATTNAPPPFFPPFFPFFPYFPPFFPYFPPFFPYFPPFFPYFPPFFPFFPGFGPFFPGFTPPPPPPSKTAPSNYMKDGLKITLLTSEYGYLEPKYLTEEDALVCVDIEVTDLGVKVIETTSTNIVNVQSTYANMKMVYINGDSYPENTMLLSTKDGVSQFIKSTELDESYSIFDYESMQFIKVESVSVEDFYGIIYNIECSPNNNYVIQKTVGYFE
jgi:hypothetical protein